MVVLRDGDIRLIKNGTTLTQPFLSIPDVDSTSGSGHEEGLLGMAFPPDYSTSGLFYVYMVADDGDPDADGPPHGPIQIREYERSTGNPDVADPTGRLVLEIAHEDHSNHYGGMLQFGPDGMLYAGTGDGGGTGDPGENAEDTASRLGKILRFDPRQNGADPYSVPPTNPFANNVGGDELVYSWGLRNPFRFSFDRLTGDLTIGDVGQSSFEEIDFASSASGRGLGAYFGWDSCEGFAAYPSTTDPCAASGDRPPAFAYAHSNPGCNSITGGVVVRDPALPTLAGRYLYAEFCKDYIHAICLPSGTLDADSELGTVGSVAGFGETATGGVIVVQLTGQVSRLSGSLDLPACPAPPGGGPGGGAPGTPVTPSAPAFTFSLAGALRQRPLRSRHVGVRLRCNRACSARAVGTLTLRSKGRRVRLRQALGRRSSAGSITLKLRLTKSGRRLLRRALRAHRHVRASMSVRVRDATGTLGTRQRTIRLAR